MCGITGWIDWEEDLTRQRKTIEKMMHTLRFRGPDAEGTYITRQAAFGHRRLSVVDPEGGGQPMIRQKGAGTFVITYNGELYNTAELRRELEAEGFAFSTHSDTEVLLSAYIAWGPACVEKFNGIYAFGIWSEAEQSLFLARDRIGVKPLFYTRQGTAFLFASELKALLAHPAVPPIIDAEGLAEVFMIGPARTPGKGVFCGVEELKPGHCLLYNRAGIHITRYWKLESRPHEDDFETTAQKVRFLLRDAVRRQLVSDVPVCMLLSGGLDSSIITAFSSQAYRDQGLAPAHTYSIDYVNNDLYFQPDAFQPDADGPWAKRVSEYCGTQHHIVLLDVPELAETLPVAALSRDLPGMADIDTSLYLFCREIKKGATVALSGECADEVFGGYPWFWRQDMLNADTFPWSLATDSRLEWISPEVREKTRALEYVQQRYQDTLQEVPRLPGEDPVAAREREMFYLSLTRWMPTLLDRKDRMSMAWGLEVRVPYCDHRLVEYVWNVPWEMKNFQQREKGLLRYAMKGVLPDDVVWRRKSPYPKTHAPQFYSHVRDWCMRIMADPASPLLPLIDREKIRTLARTDAFSTNIPWFGQLMKKAQLFAYLIQVDSWMREYKIQIV